MKCSFYSCTNEVRENPYRGRQTLYCSKSCKSKSCVNEHRRRRKQQFVDYKGGSCSICGYSKSLAALQFHHLDPAKKDFNITRATTITLNKAKVELDKCILVCANCHFEIHQGLHDDAKENKPSLR